MKIGNLKRAGQLGATLKRLQEAKKDVEKWLGQKNHDSDGHGVSEPDALYNIAIFEYSDSSGHSIDLAGLGVGIELLRNTENAIDRRIFEVEQEIESL